MQILKKCHLIPCTGLVGLKEYVIHSGPERVYKKINSSEV